MLANPRAEIEEVVWWLVERFQDPHELAEAFARAHAFQEICYYSEIAALLMVKRDILTGHWHPRLELAA